MKNTPSFPPYSRNITLATTVKHKTRDAGDFLRSNNALAAILPSITRMASLQKACAAILPAIFNYCDVSQFEDGHLVLRTPNAALATKLKQQLPKLQDQLLRGGWQVNTIRIKVQVRPLEAPPHQITPAELTPRAVNAFAQLDHMLEDSPRNQALKAALQSILLRNRSDR